MAPSTTNNNHSVASLMVIGIEPKISNGPARRGAPGLPATGAGDVPATVSMSSVVAG